MPGASNDLEIQKDLSPSSETLDFKHHVEAASGDLNFPEGSPKGWCTILGAFLVQFATLGYINAFGVYQDFYVREYLTNYSPRDIGWIGGMQVCLLFCCGIVTGRAFDRGYFYHLIFGGSLLHTLSFILLSFSEKNKYYQIFLTQGLGGGFASGIMYIPSVTVPSHYFQEKRAMAMGIVTAGVALGAIVQPALLNRLLHGPVGFHNGVRISTALNSSLLFLACLLMRTRLPPKEAGSGMPLRTFLRDPPYIFAVLGGACFLGGFFLIPFYLQLDAISRGVDKEVAFNCLSILSVASFFGRIIPPILAPKLGVLNLLFFATTSMAISIIAFGLARNAGGFEVVAVFYGFFSGAAIALTPPSLTSLAKDMSEYGARIGIHFTAAGIVGLFASPILGALLTDNLEWWRTVLFGGATMVVSSLFYCISRTLIARRKGSTIV